MPHEAGRSLKRFRMMVLLLLLMVLKRRVEALGLLAEAADIISGVHSLIVHLRGGG
jgi:hypothetical protein